MNKTTEYANSVFEQPWWLETVAPGKWGEVHVKEGEEIIARLPLCMDKGKVFMPPYTQTLGPWIKAEYREFNPGNTQLSKQKEIVAELISQLPNHKSFRMTFDSVNDYILPYRWQGFTYTPSFSYRIHNLKDLDAVYSKFNKTLKKNIKYARNKTHIIQEDGASNIILLLEKTYSKQNRNIPGGKALVEKIITSAINEGHGKILTAIDPQGNVHSSAFLLYDRNVCYYLIGGSDPEFRSSGAQSLVLWEAIQFAATVSAAFDFEGSNIESIENFFRQFGGERVINYDVSKQSLLQDCMDLVKPRIKRLIGYKI